MAKKQAKSSKTPLARQDDARTPLDSAAFLAATRPVLKTLQADLLARADGSASLVSALRARWNAETEAHRTADVFEVWRRNLVGQVAAAWLLSVVFVRTLEDRGLLDRNRIAGPGALDSQQQFLQLAPYLSERDYLLLVFRELTRLPAAAAMFDARHSLVWLLAPSAEGAKALLGLFRTPEADAPAFRFGQSDTRFLGDLYQDLDEDVRARYALLQTPDFIESFILDRTLERSIEEFGLDATTMIDPTCGSGHFLLGAFDRLFEHRIRKAPGLDPREAARLALEAVHGVDINPYSIAIARVRLTLAALEKGNYTQLKTAPALPLNLVVADSLLHRVGEGQASFGDARGQSAQAWKGDAFALEDEDAAKELLAKRFAVVVGNPPYITVKDAALRDEYRKHYRACHREYSLAAPFTERFFQLACPSGFVGQITANSFMKREFGKKLIEEVLPEWNLELIVNTSGAFIPGHGTPTVLMFGRNEVPRATHVQAVLAKRGEPSTPADPEHGLVWRSIADHWNEIGFENDFVSNSRIERLSLNRHPWSLGGGGASELKLLLEERSATRLADQVTSIGFMCITKQDDVFAQPDAVLQRQGVKAEWRGRFVVGEHVRDWTIDSDMEVVFPYTQQGQLRPLEPSAMHFLWPYRTVLAERAVFGGQTFRTSGRPWYAYGQIPADRILGPAIAFAEVATHNHFVLDRGGKVFKQTAPIIKLPDGATEDDHLALLAYLNSSTACFWMKQVAYPKASASGDVSVEKGRPEANRYAFAGTGLSALPIPKWTAPERHLLVSIAREAAAIAARLLETGGTYAVKQIALGKPAMAVRHELSKERAALNGRLVVLQEDIDWLVYKLFDLSKQFAFTTSAFAESAKRPYLVSESELDLQWKARKREMDASTELSLIEDAVYKRPWWGRQGVFGHGTRSLDQELLDAGDEWLLCAAEAVSASSDVMLPLVEVVRQLARQDGAAAVMELVGAARGAREVDAALCESEAVPFLSAYRHTDAGKEKRDAWERTWDLQRQEDGGRTSVGVIPVPPKYDVKDFRSQVFWRLRGKLDVPKERFISYPGCESDHDKSPVYGWAGWNHLQQAQALAALYLTRKNEEGWKADRLVPMLAGVLELVPWVKQWHNEPNAEFGGERLGDYFARFVDDECRALKVSHDDLRAWRPPAKGNKRTAKLSLTLNDAVLVATAEAVKKPRKPRKKPVAPSGTSDESPT